MVTVVVVLASTLVIDLLLAAINPQDRAAPATTAVHTTPATPTDRETP
jgi:hypothetical protein